MMTTQIIKIPVPTLEHHLQDCEERYQAVVNKLDTLDTRMSRVEQLLLEIKDAVKR